MMPTTLHTGIGILDLFVRAIKFFFAMASSVRLAFE